MSLAPLAFIIVSLTAMLTVSPTFPEALETPSIERTRDAFPLEQDAPIQIESLSDVVKLKWPSVSGDSADARLLGSDVATDLSHKTEPSSPPGSHLAKTIGSREPLEVDLKTHERSIPKKNSTTEPKNPASI